MGPIYTWHDFVDMIRRRMVIIVLVITAGCVASYFWANSLVHQYQSAEVIQVEQPTINNEMARSTVDGSFARRLQLIEQQIMARSSLQEVIEKFNLYADLSALRPSEKVQLLRESVTMTGMAAAREGFADDGAISVVTITAQMEDPLLARDVTAEFADRMRTLMETQRREQTAQTLAFFEQQAQVVQRDIATLEAELTLYRAQNNLDIEGGNEFLLSEIAQLNEAILDIDRETITTQLALTQIDRTGRTTTVERQTRELDAELQTLQQQRSLMDQRRVTLRETIQATPEIQQGLASFERRMTQLRTQLEGITTRRNEAQVGLNLELGAQGERLITLEEAQIPDFSITRSKAKSALLGAMAAAGLALAIAFLLELRHPVIRSAQQMDRETGLKPVVSIPELPSDYQSKRRRKAQEKRRTQRQAEQTADHARHS